MSKKPAKTISMREARQARGLTLKDVAAQCGISESQLSRIETGNVPSPVVASILYDTYEGQVSLADIYHQPPPAEARRIVANGARS